MENQIEQVGQKSDYYCLLRISEDNGLGLLGARRIVGENAWYVLAVKDGPLVGPMKRTELDLDEMSNVNPVLALSQTEKAPKLTDGKTSPPLFLCVRCPGLGTHSKHSQIISTGILKSEIVAFRLDSLAKNNCSDQTYADFLVGEYLRPQGSKEKKQGLRFVRSISFEDWPKKQNKTLRTRLFLSWHYKCFGPRRRQNLNFLIIWTLEFDDNTFTDVRQTRIENIHVYRPDDMGGI